MNNSNVDIELKFVLIDASNYEIILQCPYRAKPILFTYILLHY